MSAKKISVELREHRYFQKIIYRLSGKIWYIIRVLKDGSGFIYEKKMCGNCGDKFTGAKIKGGPDSTVTIYCPACGKQ